MPQDDDTECEQEERITGERHHDHLAKFGVTATGS